MLALQLSRIALLVGAHLLLCACSKTMQWEEEVSLNTGETIWIERTMPWALLRWLLSRCRAAFMPLLPMNMPPDEHTWRQG
jgi:hypothetical protein